MSKNAGFSLIGLGPLVLIGLGPGVTKRKFCLGSVCAPRALSRTTLRVGP